MNKNNGKQTKSGVPFGVWASIKKGTGLLVIEVINSNPNGNPDNAGAPRVRDDGTGEIAPQSVKRKLRDLVDLKEGPVWQSIAQDLGLDVERFHILESRGRTSEQIVAEVKRNAFVSRYWDSRTFGRALLEASDKTMGLTADQKAPII